MLSVLNFFWIVCYIKFFNCLLSLLKLFIIMWVLFGFLVFKCLISCFVFLVNGEFVINNIGRLSEVDIEWSIWIWLELICWFL